MTCPHCNNNFDTAYDIALTQDEAKKTGRRYVKADQTCYNCKEKTEVFLIFGKKEDE